MVSVLLVKVSLPASVAKVPVVGKVTAVVPLTVSVVPKLPEMARVLAALFATPVPPLAAPNVPDTSVVRETAAYVGGPDALPCNTVAVVPKLPKTVGEAPAPPPRTIAFEVSAADDAIVPAAVNARTPPDVPDVMPVPPLATGTVPVRAVNWLDETLTKSVPFQAQTAYSPLMTVTPVVGPAPTSLMLWVLELALMTM